MRVILHGSLKEFPSMDIEAKTVAEAIEGWSRQCGMQDIPLFNKPVIAVLGFDNPEQFIQETDVEELHLVPAMFGGGGSFGKIIVGAALIAISFLPFIPAPLKVALISSGIGMIVGGVMQMFMKAPTTSKSNDPDASKYLGLGSNTTAIGTLITKGYGRCMGGGQYLSVQVNATDMVTGRYPTNPPS